MPAECLLCTPPPSHLLQSPSFPTCVPWFPGLAPEHSLSFLDWGFIFKKEAKHIFNSHNQMERALLRQHRGNKTEQADVANLMKAPGAGCQLSRTWENAFAV